MVGFLTLARRSSVTAKLSFRGRSTVIRLIAEVGIIKYLNVLAFLNSP